MDAACGAAAGSSDGDPAAYVMITEHKGDRMRSVWLIAALLLVTSCGGDPGRDVRPMADPLRENVFVPAEDDTIIPLEEVRRSQAAAVSQRIANTEITVTYSRPVARGRELFGALVPYGDVWNPGADQATAVAVTRDVEIEGHALPAGRYSLWAIPRADRWTVIFSSAADVYHTPYPGEDLDALRLDVRPETGPHMETLAFSFPIVEGKDAVLTLHWGEVMVPLSVRVP
jgi:hypothetical protein